MPCLLKEQTANSPGVVTFTNNEVVNGVLATSPRAREFVSRYANKDWLFGVHLQSFFNPNDCWQLEDWQSFVMWPDRGAAIVADIPPSRLIDLNCVNFLPMPSGNTNLQKNVDVCVVSRPSTVKRIEATLRIIRSLMDLRPKLTATLVVPDYRKIDMGDALYTAQDVDPKFYELPKKLFSAVEMKQLSFLCSAEESFGRLPLSNDLMSDLLQRSRFLLLTSHREGTPRVIVESLMAGVPCILSKNIECGVRSVLTDKNCLFVDDEILLSARQIDDAIAHYGRYDVDQAGACAKYGADANIPPFKSTLSERIAALGKPVEGRWFLDDLHLRLAGHGQKFNLQLMNDEKPFFKWFDLMACNAKTGGPSVDPYDEDTLFEGTDPNNRPTAQRLPFLRYAKGIIRGGMNCIRRQMA